MHILQKEKLKQIKMSYIFIIKSEGKMQSLEFLRLRETVQSGQQQKFNPLNLFLKEGVTSNIFLNIQLKIKC